VDSEGLTWWPPGSDSSHPGEAVAAAGRRRQLTENIGGCSALPGGKKQILVIAQPGGNVG